MTRLHFAFRGLVLLTLGLLLGTVAGAQSIRPKLVGLPTSDSLFDDTVVHQLRLRMNSQDWQTLKDHYLENGYYPADFYWRDQVVRNVGIRSRGTGSRSPVKPGLKVAFDRYVGDQTFLGLTSIVLRNNTQDPSNMRERISMQLLQRMGLPAPRESYARFYVNDEYLGIYTIVETIDDRFLGRHFSASDGYLFSFDYPANAPPFHFEDRGSAIAPYVPQPFKPENHTSDPQSEVIVRMVQTVNQASDAVFASAAGAFVDLSALTRQTAVEAFLGDNDGLLGDWGMNNVYLYRLQANTRFTFLAWDKSNTSLRGVDGSIWHNLVDVPAAQRNRLVDRTLAVPEFRRLYLETLAECVRSAGEIDPERPDAGGWMEREIQREYAQIRDAAWADAKKPFTNDEFEQGVNDLRAFAAGRGPSVTREVEAARATP